MLDQIFDVQYDLVVPNRWRLRSWAARGAFRLARPHKFVDTDGVDQVLRSEAADVQPILGWLARGPRLATTQEGW